MCCVARHLIQSLREPSRHHDISVIVGLLLGVMKLELSFVQSNVNEMRVLCAELEPYTFDPVCLPLRKTFAKLILETLSILDDALFMHSHSSVLISLSSKQILFGQSLFILHLL